MVKIGEEGAKKAATTSVLRVASGGAHETGLCISATDSKSYTSMDRKRERERDTVDRLRKLRWIIEIHKKW